MKTKTIRKNLSSNKNQLHIRITSKQRLGLEIIRRKKRRSISSLVVRLIEDEMKNIVVRYDSPKVMKKIAKSSLSPVKVSDTVKRAAHQVYDKHQPDQFVAFALHFAHLLNPIEKELWSLIRSNPFFWESREPKNENLKKLLVHPSCPDKTLKREVLRVYWDSLNRIAQDFYHQQLCEL